MQNLSPLARGVFKIIGASAFDQPITREAALMALNDLGDTL